MTLTYQYEMDFLPVENTMLTASYRKHGEIHRLNGPAILFKYSAYFAAWYQYGVAHRDIGPAYLRRDSNSTYYHRGIKYDNTKISSNLSQS